MSDVITPAALAAKARNTLVTRFLAATDLFNGKYYTTVKGDATPKPTSEAALRAEAMYNDPESAVYGSKTFAALIKATTGEDLRFVSDTSRRVEFNSCGVVVVPVEPEYGKRADDGYELGLPVAVTNRSNGKGRNSKNLGTRINDVAPLSTNSAHWRVATQSEIEGIVDELIAHGGLKFLKDMSGEFDEIDAILKDIV